MRTALSAIVLMIGTIVFALGICEISFPDVFSWTEVLIETFPKIYRYGLWIGIGEVLFGALAATASWFLDRVFAKKGLETLFRIGIGGMFVFASWFKIADPKGFAILVAQYQFLPHDLVNFFALVMPMAEILFGFTLIFTPFVKESALAIFGMFLSFMAALVWALWLDLGITCGCFALEGAQDKSEAWTALIRDLILIGPTLWLTTTENRSLWGIWKK